MMNGLSERMIQLVIGHLDREGTLAPDQVYWPSGIEHDHRRRYGGQWEKAKFNTIQWKEKHIE